MASVYITTHLSYPPNLLDEQIRAIAGALINRLYIDQPIPFDKFADITYEQEFIKKQIPKNKLIKMSKTKYIDDFFENGKLQLGTFNYYKQFDNPEIGDNTEGSFIVVGENDNNTTFAEIASGFENYVFCCYDGEPNPKVIEQFGYNDYFEIIDYEGFSEAIKKSLACKKSFHSQCIYKVHKVLVGKSPIGFTFSVISGQLKNLVSDLKYYLKTNEYEHQQEFRFTWEMEDDVTNPIVIECKDAVKFCRRK